MPFFTKNSLGYPTQQDATKKKYPKLKILKKNKNIHNPQKYLLRIFKTKHE